MPRVKQDSNKEAGMETVERPYDASDERDNSVKPEEASNDAGDDSDE